jgi:hypothetical protein
VELVPLETLLAGQSVQPVELVKVPRLAGLLLWWVELAVPQVQAVRSR